MLVLLDNLRTFKTIYVVKFQLILFFSCITLSNVVSTKSPVDFDQEALQGRAGHGERNPK